MTTSTGSTTDRSIDPRSVLARAIATGGAVIAGVRPDQLTAPTPCPEMDVRAMLSHLVGVLDRIAASRLLTADGRAPPIGHDPRAGNR